MMDDDQDGWSARVTPHRTNPAHCQRWNISMPSSSSPPWSSWWSKSWQEHDSSALSLSHTTNHHKTSVKFWCHQLGARWQSKGKENISSTEVSEPEMNLMKMKKCNQCDYSSAYTSHMKNHIQTHTGEKPFRCDQCDLSFSRASYLKVHVRVHTGEKPYKCEQCNFSFSDAAGNLKKHATMHAGEKPNKCTQCDYAAIQAAHLRKHMMKMHTILTWYDNQKSHLKSLIIIIFLWQE